ncbi:unnamed protein product [Periconia digitata]|uniref:Rhodopsin domain-containing protein n=1 Tax=Periconia digitata TaxID=1303443 RepID=A0A9W4UBE6_9PLEO|nr:unnamed protein product [Periconia digitata]
MPSVQPLSPEVLATLPDNSNPPISNRKETIIGVSIAFLTVALTAALLRLFVRWRRRIWGWDDAFVVLAATGCTIGSILICQMPDDGLGKHWWTLTAEQRMMFFKHIWATNITYAFSTTCVKIAILVQYLRLFEAKHVLARRLILGLLTFIALWGFTFTMLSVFSCSPISSFWRKDMPGKCVGWGSKNTDDFFATFLGHAASNMVLDILVLGLPIPFFRDLRMSGKTKLGLMTLFGMGGIAVSLAIARVASLCHKKGGTIPIFDITYSTPTVYIFSVLEINVAIMCASIPIFWPLVTSFTSSKILIVNEIEVRSERRSEHIDLVDKAHDFTVGEIEGRTSRADIKGNTTTQTTSPSSRLARSLSRHHRQSYHHHQQNSSSSSKDMPLSLRHAHSRQSEDDSKSLVHKSSTHSFGNNSNKNPLAGLDNPEDNTHARYKDKYSQGWAVPDFDHVAPPPTTYRADAGANHRAGSPAVMPVPFDHIGAAKQ